MICSRNDASAFDPASPLNIARAICGSAPTESGHYEWWYFDCHFKDGTSIAVVFYTKPLASADWSLTPEISIDVTRRDGTIHKTKLRAALLTIEGSRRWGKKDQPFVPALDTREFRQAFQFMH